MTTTGDQAVGRRGAPAEVHPEGTALQRLLVAPLRAGLLGAGVFSWSLGLVLGAAQARFFHRPPEEPILLGCFGAAAIVVIAIGYRPPIRSYLGILGRFAGGLAGGLAVFFAFLAVAARFRDKWTSEGRPALFAIPGLCFAVAALAWIHRQRLEHRLRASLRARWILGGALGALFLFTAGVLSARLRCALGSGDACYAASWRFTDTGDFVRAAALVQRGCDLDSALACRAAGDALWNPPRDPAAPPRDGARAAPFYQAACALGDETGCEALQVVELHARCEGQRASACRELAQVYREGGGVARDVNAASRYLRQACLLGDTEACQGGR